MKFLMYCMGVILFSSFVIVGIATQRDTVAVAAPPPPQEIQAQPVAYPDLVAAEEETGTVAEAPSEDAFDAAIAYTPEDDVQVADSSGYGCRVSETYPDSILQWCGIITHYGDQHGLHPDLVAAVMLQESGGKHLAYSHSGAVGLMQVMPRDGIAQKFMCKNGPCFTSRPTISELEDPEFNVAYGTRMLSGLNSRFGNIRDALKSYGPMDVGYSYADKVLAIWERYGQ